MTATILANPCTTASATSSLGPLLSGTRSATSAFGGAPSVRSQGPRPPWPWLRRTGLHHRKTFGRPLLVGGRLRSTALTITLSSVPAAELRRKIGRAHV